MRRQASAIEDLKTIAISRLRVRQRAPRQELLGHARPGHRESSALNFGASDLDGTIGVEKIAHAALARSPVGLAEEAMVQTIREAGKVPVQRDALYRVVREYASEDAAAPAAAR